MSFINSAEVVEVTKQVLAVGAGTPTAPQWGVLGGVAYQPGDDAMAVIASVPTATDSVVNGLTVTPDNRLYVWPVSTLGTPPLVFWNGGLPFVPDGRLVVTSNPVFLYVGGWPVDVNGWVCMSLSGPPPPPVPGPFTFTAFNFNPG